MASIRMQSVRFDEDRIERHGMGAGIVLFAVDEHDHVHFLLGRERLSPWKGSCRWSGFQGARVEGETLLATACREYCEESLHVFHKPQLIYEQLKAKRFWKRVVLRLSPNSERTERYHCTWVVRVPYDPMLPERFHNVRADLEAFDRQIQQLRYTRPSELGPFPVAIGPITVSNEACICVEQDNASTPKWFTDDTAKLIQKWNTIRTSLEKQIPDHPSVQVIRDDQWGYIQDAYLREEHMEKDTVRWWSEDDLRRVLEQRGHLNAEHFRPYFLPVMQVIFSELDRCRAPAWRCEAYEDDCEAPTTPCATLPPTEPPREGACPVDAEACNPPVPSDSSLPKRTEVRTP